MQRQVLRELRQELETIVKEKNYAAASTLLQRDPFWQPSGLQENAISRCKAYCQRDGEVWLKGWVCLSVNEWGSQQERIVLLNNMAYYRIKYDYETGRIVHFRRTPLSSISRIEHGQFQLSSWSLTGSISKEKIEKRSGFRIHKKFVDGRKNLADAMKSMTSEETHESLRTYIPVFHGSETTESARQVAQQELVEEIASAFSAVIRMREDLICPVSNTRLEWKNPGGVLSAAYNTLKIGNQTL